MSCSNPLQKRLKLPFRCPLSVMKVDSDLFFEHLAGNESLQMKLVENPNQAMDLQLFALAMFTKAIVSRNQYAVHSSGEINPELVLGLRYKRTSIQKIWGKNPRLQTLGTLILKLLIWYENNPEQPILTALD